MVAAAQLAPAIDLDTFLKQNEEKELLRFTTAGSVDDGKSTLIGRLLYDSKGIYEDHLASIRRPTMGSEGLDFALLTDGLRAEREQGITIDVAYRYFSTPKRKFIIADTPGHEQYTRNMATGASTANLAIILVDARYGVLSQSRRHSFIASLLGIPHLVVAVNKMDLVGFDEQVFTHIQEEFTRFAAQFNVTDIRFIPISALHGDNVVLKSARMPWYQGESLLHYLENVHIASDRNLMEMRLPVQLVIRPNLDFRGYAGQIASGILKVGDPVTVLPSAKISRVKAIVTYDGNVRKAFAPMAVTVCLEDDVDVSRGDMLVNPQHPPHVSRRLDARVVWMNEQVLEPGREYLVKHTTQTVRARVLAIRYKMDVNTLERNEATQLGMNDIGAVVIECRRPLFFDPYRRNRATGSLIFIDPITNETVAAGMITARPPVELNEPSILFEGIRYEDSRVSLSEREAKSGHKPAALWLVGDEELAYTIERRLFDMGCAVHVVVGGNDTAVLAGLAKMSLAAGLITICSVDSNDRGEAARARGIVGETSFVLVDAATLPTDRAAAAAAVCDVLFQKGVLRRPV